MSEEKRRGFAGVISTVAVVCTNDRCSESVDGLFAAQSNDVGNAYARALGELG